MGSASKSSSATGTVVPPQYLGDLRASMCFDRGFVCLETVSISIPRTIATAAVTSSTIPDPGP